MCTPISAVLLLALLAGPALPHGGQYKGPSDAAGPNQGDGGTVTAPTNPEGALGPSAGATSSSSGAAGTARGNSSRGRSHRNGTAPASGGSAETDLGWEIWEFWWEHNKDRFLDLKGRLTRNTTISGSANALTGRGRKSQLDDSRRPTPGQVEAEIVPALLELVRTSDDADILDSAILALGRTTGGPQAAPVVAVAVPLLGHRELSVQSSAALALGVLGSPAATQVLQDVLQDNSAGRQLTGGSTPDLVRAFAALSLGLIGDRESVRVLKDVVQRLPDTEADVKVCALVGLGLLDADVAAAEGVTAFLVERLADRRVDDMIKSYVPTSLGKLGRPEAVAPLLASFADRDTANPVRQSCALGLGLLATPADISVVEALLDYVAEGKDQQTRHFAIIALGEIGARGETAQDAGVDATHEAIRDRLLREIAGKGKSQAHRSWAALAGALYSRARPDSQAAFVARIRDAYDRESDPSFKSAFAIALGLLDDVGSAGRLFEDFSRSRDSGFQGYAGVALGFLQHREAAEPLRGLCQNKGTTPTLRLQAATALGLLSDTQAVGLLIDTLRTARTLGVSSAVARSLGLIGDRDSIGPLAAVAADEGNNKLTRAFAAVALGLVGEKTELPWNAAISANNNYRAKVPSLEEVLDIL